METSIYPYPVLHNCFTTILTFLELYKPFLQKMLPDSNNAHPTLCSECSKTFPYVEMKTCKDLLDANFEEKTLQYFEAKLAKLVGELHPQVFERVILSDSESFVDISTKRFLNTMYKVIRVDFNRVNGIKNVE